MLARYLKAWGWWLAGATTVLLAFWLATRKLYANAETGDELDVGDTLG
jgi:hypothetical protein